MRNRLIVILLIVFLHSPAFAAPAWTGWGTVSEVYSSDGTHAIKTTISSAPCTYSGKFWWPADDPDAQDMLSISLTALASGKRVRLVIDEEAPNCRFGGALATQIGIGNE